MSQSPHSSHPTRRDAATPLALQVELTLKPIARGDERHALLLEHQLEALIALILRASGDPS